GPRRLDGVAPGPGRPRGRVPPQPRIVRAATGAPPDRLPVPPRGCRAPADGGGGLQVCLYSRLPGRKNLGGPPEDPEDSGDGDPPTGRCTPRTPCNPLKLCKPLTP